MGVLCFDNCCDERRAALCCCCSCCCGLPDAGPPGRWAPNTPVSPYTLVLHSLCCWCLLLAYGRLLLHAAGTWKRSSCCCCTLLACKRDTAAAACRSRVKEILLLRPVGIYQRNPAAACCWHVQEILLLHTADIWKRFCCSCVTRRHNRGLLLTSPSLHAAGSTSIH